MIVGITPPYCQPPLPVSLEGRFASITEEDRFQRVRIKKLRR
jgi:hypothetical protein